MNYRHFRERLNRLETKFHKPTPDPETERPSRILSDPEARALFLQHIQARARHDADEVERLTWQIGKRLKVLDQQGKGAS